MLFYKVKCGYAYQSQFGLKFFNVEKIPYNTRKLNVNNKLIILFREINKTCVQKQNKPDVYKRQVLYPFLQTFNHSCDMAGSCFRPLSNIPHCCLPQKFGPCLSPNVAVHPLRPAIDLSLIHILLVHYRLCIYILAQKVVLLSSNEIYCVSFYFIHKF